jgi:hypothetical protein
MSTFREYLKNKNANPDSSFQENDESCFIVAMLFLRLGLHGKPGHETFEAFLANAEHRDDLLASIKLGPDTEAALTFISTFFCFFGVKPEEFMRTIGPFKDYFIPGFSRDREKRSQLFALVNPAFSQTLLQPSQWQSVDYFFKDGWKKDVLQLVELKEGTKKDVA